MASRILQLLCYQQEGKLDREAAIAYAEKLGLIDAEIQRTQSLSMSSQIFNFSVYKWSRSRTVQRLILQVLLLLWY